MDRFFADATFNAGWEKKSSVRLFGYDYPITVSATAYYDYEKATEQQESSYSRYLDSEAETASKIGRLLVEEAGGSEEAKRRFTPQMLVVQKDGSSAMLFDDADEFENGIAICIEPKLELMPIDQYL